MAVQILVDFMYTGNFDIKPSQLQQVKIAAVQLDISLPASKSEPLQIEKSPLQKDPSICEKGQLDHWQDSEETHTRHLVRYFITVRQVCLVGVSRPLTGSP